MKRGIRLGVLVLVVVSGAAEVHAASDRGFSLSVLVEGSERPEYPGRGRLYVEAIREAPYAIRLSNPTPHRVAVALSVDGLNTIDARHTDAWSARKWVLEPYETSTIPGWQVSGSTARAFFFTGEKRSYGALLGKTEDLGVIEAVFFRESSPLPAFPMSSEPGAADGTSGLRRDAAAPRAPAAAGEAGEKAQALSDELAATGMGQRHDHSVFEVAMRLDRQPVARVRLRYEFRPQLVALGVLPRLPEELRRRERSSGFSEFCPEPR
jgi:hypothetical protein